MVLWGHWLLCSLWIRMARILSQSKTKKKRKQKNNNKKPFVAYHFFDFSRGGGFLGMRNSALIGCMSQRAGERRRSCQYGTYFTYSWYLGLTHISKALSHHVIDMLYVKQARHLVMSLRQTLNSPFKQPYKEDQYNDKNVQFKKDVEKFSWMKDKILIQSVRRINSLGF